MKSVVTDVAAYDWEQDQPPQRPFSETVIYELHVAGEIVPHAETGDILIEDGNSCYIDDINRAKMLAEKGIEYVDVGTSGGVWGLERGDCMMIGGSKATMERLDPIFNTISAMRYEFGGHVEKPAEK
jgi:6-phosphogluconate dehydrogenase (decarboxylating)